MNLPTFPRPRRRGIYLLPNLFTTAALFAGFYAIVQVMQPSPPGFEVAAIAIFVGMVLDGLDGRIARLTNTQSEFGAQYDSLSDMVCFGVAPALVIYEWALKDLGKLGWIAAFIYCAGAALRLARFNTNIDVVDKRFFQGLPSPAAAALIAGLVWISIDNKLATEVMPDWLSGAACVLTLIAGISMVTNLPYWSGKTINLRKSVPFIFVIAVVLAFALAATYPPGVFFGLFVAYALSGYVLAFARWWRRRSQIRASEEAEETEASQSPRSESLDETPRNTEQVIAETETKPASETSVPAAAPSPESRRGRSGSKTRTTSTAVKKYVTETESPLQGMEDVFAEAEVEPPSYGVKKALEETKLNSYDMDKTLAETESTLAMLAKSLAAQESPQANATNAMTRLPPAPSIPPAADTVPLKKRRTVVKRDKPGSVVPSDEQPPKDAPA